MVPKIGGSLLRPLHCPSSTASRNFTTTALVSNQVPPESPSYIRLPSTPQSQDKQYQRVRGQLPIPRDIFKGKDSSRKVQRKYLQQTAPKPKAQHKSSAERLWKDQVAQARRENLRHGLDSLWQRKAQAEKDSRKLIALKTRQHQIAATKPERRDDVYTRGTVLDSLMNYQVTVDQHGFARADRSRSKVAAVDNEKRESRRDALMELYISASNFIVGEQELKREVDTLFSEDYFKNQSQSTNRFGVENAWGVWGPPTSLQELLHQTTASETSNKIIDLDLTDYDRSVKRQKKIAEEFTGGKMD